MQSCLKLYNERESCQMDTKQMKQEDFLQILMHAYTKGEHTNEMTTKEMLEEIILQIKKVYAS